MAYFRDLRAFLDLLDERGKLFRVPDPIDKDTELLPMHRVQLRGLPEAERKVLLFEHVTNAEGRRYDMSVASGVYGLSDEIIALALGCEREQMLERWHQAIENPIPPVVVADGSCQEEVHTGEDLLRDGLEELPVPVEEPGFSQILRTGVPVVTRDPETGQSNLGTYNAFLRDRGRLVFAPGPRQDAGKHWDVARRRGEELPIAIAIGTTPNLTLVGGTDFALGVDELAIAGAIAGQPVEMVPCRTVPLEVPASAEIIIEGMMSTEILEPRLGFGEYPGYLNMERNNRPIVRVTAITHRKNAIFTPVLVGFPPSDTNTLLSFCNAATLYHQLRYGCSLPIDDVHFPEMGGGYDFCVLRIEKDARANVWQILQAAGAMWPCGKFIIAVDHDVDVRDPDLLIWALTYRVRPEQDVVFQPGRIAALDPSFGPTGSSRGQIQSGGNPRQNSRILIDATVPGVYPPVALPAKAYMERAVELWNRYPELGKPKLRTPWHGYTLGFWTEEDQHLADLIAGGDFRAVGRIMREMQVGVEKIAVPARH